MIYEFIHIPGHVGRARADLRGSENLPFPETRRVDAVAARERRRVRAMAIMFPSGLGMSAMEAWNRTLPSCSALNAANSAPPGPSAPPPRNHGSTMSVNVAEGTSPSRICLACGQIV